MATLCEYTTVTKAKTYSDITANASDGLLLDMIRQASREIEDITNRWFFPRVATQLYDTPRSMDLLLNNDLLEVTTLTNGDGTVITSADYKLYDLNAWPKRKITLLPIHFIWQRDTFGNPNGAITLLGIFGFHDDYPNAWVDVGSTITAAITTAGQASGTVTPGTLNPGDLVKIDTEFLYISTVTAANPDTVTWKRGVNGSTAATHLINAPILRWDPGQELEMLCRRAAAAYTKLRANPTSETVTLDGVQFNTPKDVIAWMEKQLRGLGLVRTGLG